MSSPEWVTILFGCMACIWSGVSQPLTAIFFAKTVNVSDASKTHLLTVGSIVFLLLGIRYLLLQRATLSSAHLQFLVLVVGSCLYDSSFRAGTKRSRLLQVM
jgi:hypothetical protein